ncbi:MAG TPA: S-layer homology domain-containing protein, partial [Thermoleophilia bacterium]|nr:S-layer homology domain-containing protein [Thermoleophilia bacterium]
MKKTILIALPMALLVSALLLGGPAISPAQAHPSSFTDVAETNPAHEAIESLAAEDVVSGDPGGDFLPNAFVSRGEAAKTLVKWQGMETASAISRFSDVDTTYQPYVDAAFASGWVTGYPDGTFRPDRPLTREQMITIVIRSLGLEPQAKALTDWQIASTLGPFLDDIAVSETARPFVALAVRSMLVAGDGGRLSPLNPVTRAQLAMMLYRAEGGSQQEAKQGSGTPTTVTTIPASTSGDQPSGDPVAGGESAEPGIGLTPEEQAQADFMTAYLFRPHNSRITGEMVLQNVDWYGIPALSQLVIMAAETSLGDPKLGGSVARANNFGCLRYHGADTPWGLLSNGRIWAAGKDWYSFSSAAVGMTAFGRYLKAGVDGFYVPILKQAYPDWEEFAAVYYGRGVSGFSA